MPGALKNYTFSLPVNLMNKLKKHVQEGRAPSINAAVREAVNAYVKLMEKQNLYSEMKKASQDPLFMEDLHKVMYDFSYADFEESGENEKA